MPDAATLLVFAAAATLIVLIPGPNHVYIAARSVSQGRSAGIASALGVETGTLVHIAAAAFGLSALIASSATAFDAVRYAGAAYLLFLGIRALRSGKHGDATAEPVQATRGRAFAEGVVVNCSTRRSRCSSSRSCRSSSTRSTARSRSRRSCSAC